MIVRILAVPHPPASVAESSNVKERRFGSVTDAVRVGQHIVARPSAAEVELGVGEVDDIAERYIDGDYRKDEVALLALYAENVIVFDMWDRWSYQGRAAWPRRTSTNSVRTD